MEKKFRKECDKHLNYNSPWALPRKSSSKSEIECVFNFNIWTGSTWMHHENNLSALTSISFASSTVTKNLWKWKDDRKRMRKWKFAALNRIKSLTNHFPLLCIRHRLGTLRRWSCSTSEIFRSSTRWLAPNMLK